ncbi:hypothetical protein BLX24_22380 [Arsenicibacter rosenii]|uniref:Uncharacterized protein n=1 Tax=Arsenicibacter rosenii TaxID=1750698 RepID=A0A1S2VDQ9_9BACT|nr:hypothetical protein BLX24_22380 [Arsenicibacter rosenii]
MGLLLGGGAVRGQNFTAPASFSFSHTGGNPAYTTRYILVNTQTNIISYASVQPGFSNVAAGTYLLYGISYDQAGVAPVLTPAASFSTIGGTCVGFSSSLLVRVSPGNGCSMMYTLKSGNWNDISVWSCGRLPTATDIVTIKPGHAILLNVNGTAKGVVYEGGKLTIPVNTKLTING